MNNRQNCLRLHLIEETATYRYEIEEKVLDLIRQDDNQAANQSCSKINQREKDLDYLFNPDTISQNLREMSVLMEMMMTDLQSKFPVADHNIPVNNIPVNNIPVNISQNKNIPRQNIPKQKYPMAELSH
ncbi:Protein of unknown function [Cotesia congregata]|uniref:Uncharacterized protein n=1 Tax=Cotesia congregata TaxID=51543 RepID=A0A8J2MNE4_COTCN|nr:Protein of unknown function [Cotesia congregata]